LVDLMVAMKAATMAVMTDDLMVEKKEITKE
jgi:hypothetical protein